MQKAIDRFKIPIKCESENCLYNGFIKGGEDVTIIRYNRGEWPSPLLDLFTQDTPCEVYHTDCLDDLTKTKLGRNE